MEQERGPQQREAAVFFRWRSSCELGSGKLATGKMSSCFRVGHNYLRQTFHGAQDAWLQSCRKADPALRESHCREGSAPGEERMLTNQVISSMFGIMSCCICLAGILLGILGGGFQPWRPLPPSILLANCQKHTEQYLRHSHCNNDHK